MKCQGHHLNRYNLRFGAELNLFLINRTEGCDPSKNKWMPLSKAEMENDDKLWLMLVSSNNVGVAQSGSMVTSQNGSH